MRGRWIAHALDQGRRFLELFFRRIQVRQGRSASRTWITFNFAATYYFIHNQSFCRIKNACRLLRFPLLDSIDLLTVSHRLQKRASSTRCDGGRFAQAFAHCRGALE